MDHQQNQPPQGGIPGPTGRRLHIAHRRSPSELTPLMSMFSSPGSEYSCRLLSLRVAVVIVYPPRISSHTDHMSDSGTTCNTATNRAVTATAAADPGYTSAICEYGDDPADSTPRTQWRIQPHTTADAEPIPSERIPISQSATTATADEHTNGCSHPAVVTSP